MHDNSSYYVNSTFSAQNMTCHDVLLNSLKLWPYFPEIDTGTFDMVVTTPIANLTSIFSLQLYQYKTSYYMMRIKELITNRLYVLTNMPALFHLPSYWISYSIYTLFSQINNWLK